MIQPQNQGPSGWRAREVPKDGKLRTEGETSEQEKKLARIQNLLNQLLKELEGSKGIIVAVDYVKGKTGPDCYMQFAMGEDGKSMMVGMLSLQATILRVSKAMADKMLADVNEMEEKRTETGS